MGDSSGAATTNPLPVAPEHDGRDQGFLEHARRRPQSAGMEMLVRMEKGHVNVRVNLRAHQLARLRGGGRAREAAAGDHRPEPHRGRQ